MKNKSAKDIAFDKERRKFQKRIRELEEQLAERDNEILNLKEQLSESEIKDDWIERLLEYTEMSKEDLKAMIEKDKAIVSASKTLDYMFRRMMR